MIQLSDNTFETELTKNRIIVARGTAMWCSPCRGLKPIFAEFEKEYDGKIQFAEINVDECPNLTEKLNINSIPDTFFFKNGIEIERIKGVKTKSFFESVIQKILNS